MDSKKIRQTFLEYFEKNGHKIVPSAPMVNSSDPSLMFTNAGMNQFKDLFLGNEKAKYKRIADTQKCLRVSGKHNDLEEVGIDSYHHTMFEMLGNWSIGDYFKKEAIELAWKLLTEVYGIDKKKLYITVFGGDKKLNLEADNEAAELWEEWVPKEQILFCGRKDNFWEMGEQGPCGPCSEIHVDIRSTEEKSKIPGRDLVNQDHPQVIEIWNLVFIQYDRKADGHLDSLPAKHIDTGMGFERLAMVLQNKTSNYETDVFQGIISRIEGITGKKYENSYDSNALNDIAFRVVADHLRAVAFGISDGEMPSNTGAGYVLRRILRRAIRYYFSFLDHKTPLIHELVNDLSHQMGDVFPELKEQQSFIAKVILEEEKSFLRTLDEGLKRLDKLISEGTKIKGADAFELYDTFGFPIDLTRLISSEKSIEIDEAGFEEELKKQRERSKKDSESTQSDWIIVYEQKKDPSFCGYDQLVIENAKLLRYRSVEDKRGRFYQLVFDNTTFYAESGGQVGDTGIIRWGSNTIKVSDTKKENKLTVHLTKELPDSLDANFTLEVNATRRKKITANHSVTHLVHAALRQVLGDHVQQKGSLVKPEGMRFDFSHFQKLNEEQITEIESIVNLKIRENITKDEQRSVPIEEAKSSGAMMLFGEKYDEEVRVISFDKNFSVELCGGCHVKSTGEIGFFKIQSETGIAAGVRRIEVCTGRGAEQFVDDKIMTLNRISDIIKSNKNQDDQVLALVEENRKLKKELEKLSAAKASGQVDELIKKMVVKDDMNILIDRIELSDGKHFKTLLFNLEKKLEKALVVLVAELPDSVQLGIIFNKKLVEQKEWHAGNLVKNWAKLIGGGGGGQAFFAVAGGKNKAGIEPLLQEAKTYFLA